MPSSTPLEIIPLGGLGEFGMNMTLYRHGRDALLVDAGLMFPRTPVFGVEAVYPDLSPLDRAGTIHGLVLTHAHEDHVGAVAHLLRRLDLPIYASPYTIAWTRKRLRERLAGEEVSFRDLDAAPSVSLGPFRIEPIRAAHSIPQTRMLALHTPVGVVVHSADFKFDTTPPNGESTDLPRLRELGRQGVIALLSDSTNAEREGFTLTEAAVTRSLEDEFRKTKRRLVVSIFSSHVGRLRRLARLAARYERRLALLGGALQNHAGVAESLGLLWGAGAERVPPEACSRLDPHKILVVAGGTQAEPGSSLLRLAMGEHPDLELEPGDRMVHSARRIPGNERPISWMLDQFRRRGVEAVTAADRPVHASGHASRDGLRLLLDLVRPRHFVPIHGGYRQLDAHLSLAHEAGIPSERSLLALSGDRIVLSESAIAIADRAPLDPLYVDRARRPIARPIFQSRRRMARDGAIVPAITIRPTSDGAPDVQARLVTAGVNGPLADPGSAEQLELERRIARVIRTLSERDRADSERVATAARKEVQRYMRKKSPGRPTIEPFVVES